MIRVKLLKDWQGNRKGSVVVIDRNEAFGLIDSGKAVISKDMTPDDYKQAGDHNGSITKLRTNNRRRR